MRSKPTFTASWLASQQPKQREKALSSLDPEELEALIYDWRFWARPSQLTPPGDWTNWMNLGGRGNGKTRCGAEFIRDEVNGGARKVALIGPTNADVRDVMLQGDNDTPGLLDVFPPNQRPLYIPSKRFVRFHTGAVATTYSAEKAARLRGPQHDRYWADEVGAWEEAGKGRLRKTWDMLMFGLRRGPHPRGICTTTPKPIPWFEEMLADPATVSTRGTTFDNEAPTSATRS